MMRLIKIWSFFLSSLILFASCASTTVIQSTPSKAKLYLNDAYAGTTPVSYTDTKIVGTCTTVRLEKEGYQTLHTYLCRNEEADVGAIIGGFFVFVPWLWVMKYHPQHHYELKPDQEALPASDDYFYEVPEDVIQQFEKPEPDKPLRTKAERLRELKELLDEGILSQEEFDNEKKKILEE